MRLIDADALIVDLVAIKNIYPMHMIRAINACPTIDAEPVKHGEWDITEDDYMGLVLMHCSLCNEEWCFEGKEEGIDMQLENFNYCPNCGAKMD